MYARSDIGEILTENRSFWRLAERTTVEQFINYLIENASLKKYELRSENYGKTITRYSWGEVSPYRLALSIKNGSYLTHGTAIFFHALSDSIPKYVYVNTEQSKKPPTETRLSQSSIDLAFTRQPRQSNLMYELDELKVVVISGKSTERLGVELMPDENGNLVDVTGLERTLIDIVVRPNYSGGVFQLLEAYVRAIDRISTNKLLSTLKKLDYAYPYHQAIGFLMEHAGYPAKKYKHFSDLGINFDFYLAHGMASTEFDSKWRLHFPKGLK